MDLWSSFDYAYGNRKGPHKQSLIIKMFFSLSKLKYFSFFESDNGYFNVKKCPPLGPHVQNIKRGEALLI